ncbi:MAG: hypothetical protein M1541_20985, partial [Acidobacteria bacterium]|nr:hypothetical protein [Acidobacteriota bacterium]
GAACLGRKHYRKFCALGTFSGAVGFAHGITSARSNAGGPDRKRTEEIQALFGPPGSAARAEKDPFVLLEKVPAAEMPLIYISCGGQDFLIEQNRRFVETQERGAVS